jgi:hypothetical protein
MRMAAPLSPSLHDLVLWRGAKWLVTRVLRLGRVEISAIMDPSVQWVCLDSQLTWHEPSASWLCNAYLIPLRGTACEE